MISEKMEKDIGKIVEKEYEFAVEKYGQFHSRHEGYAVAKDEMDEFKEEYDKLVLEMAEVWKQIKEDKSAGDVKFAISCARGAAIRMIAEGIQIAAMLEKMEVFELENGAEF